MAVQNKYVHADLVAATYKTTATAHSTGTKEITQIATWEIAAADDDASVFRFAPNIPSGVVPTSLRVACDAITGMSDADIGLYQPNLGDEVDANLLADGLNPAAGFSRILALDGLVSVDLADCGKTLWELAGQTIRNKHTAFDVAMTCNTIGSGAGTVMTVFKFLVP